MTDFLNQALQWLDGPNGDRIAYRRIEGQGPTLLWLGGFLSDMTGSKIAYLSDLCRREGRAFVCFDYFAHGETGGDFAQASVSRWRDNMLVVADSIDGPLVAIGSSMGAHMLALLLKARPGKVRAAGFIAPAPDFATKLMLPSLTPQQREAYEATGVHNMPGYDRPVPLSKAFFDDAAQHEVLNAPIAFEGPVRILHGIQDLVVPWQHGVRLLETLTTADARMELIKDGDHRLSRPQDLQRLGEMANGLHGMASGKN
ncbi:MAG TPA: alpha/beta hydrolase [Asticcacaulis sp.]|nr:alpha/beta hydrolase [Asticcacaulis sp.]